MNDKGKKIQVLLAGVYTHIIWVGLGLVTFNMLPSLVDYTIPFIVMNLGLIFLNVTFYLKLDGYYILTSIFDEPLLREHSMAMLVNKSVREQLKQKACLLYTSTRGRRCNIRDVYESLRQQDREDIFIKV